MPLKIPTKIPISEAIEVSKSYSARSGLRAGAGKHKFVSAVDSASIRIFPKESIGLVGESGSGKSTLARLLLRLEAPTDGTILFEGEDITRFKGAKLRKKRQHMQMIFQDPASSLNPRFTVEETLREAITVHKKNLKTVQLNSHIAALLEMVGLPVSSLGRLPKEFSGGERQRIAIARSLAVEPKFLIADEPVTSLDLYSQEQILTLLETLKRELGVALLFIAHDVDAVKRMCTHVAVMYLGRIVEFTTTDALFKNPAHPYSKALMSARLTPTPHSKPKINLLPGEPPSPLDPPLGCHFHPRCPHAEIECKKLVPLTRTIVGEHQVRCHFDFIDGQKKVALTPS